MYVDFSMCEFIEENLKFYTFYDFCDNRWAIKKLYQKMPRSAQRFYLWYVYANIHMDVTYKNAIWDYINGYADDDYILNYKKRYHAK